VVLPLIQPRAAAQIRSVHRNGFRSGEWADLLGVVVYEGRPCYVVLFRNDEAVRHAVELDLWVCSDSDGNYEFRERAL
jgi:hypothetical protein